jgi:hypothetical protein
MAGRYIALIAPKQMTLLYDVGVVVLVVGNCRMTHLLHFPYVLISGGTRKSNFFV